MNWLVLLLRTVSLRPYVFLFLAAFLVLAVAAWGWRRTLVFSVLGAGAAWLAEFSSLRTGFPFGHYEYLSAATRDKELWLGGVPLMSSLSFVFLTFAGLQSARAFLQPLERGTFGWWDLRWGDAQGHVGRSPGWDAVLATAALSGLLTTGLDVVIDPVSLRGSRWFLGELYRYPEGGQYFGVPLVNFAGWLLLCLAILGTFLALDRLLLHRAWGPWRSYPGDALAGVGLFSGVLLFNMAVALAIGEVGLTLLGCVWAGVMLLPLAARVHSVQRAAEPVGRD